MDIIVPLTENYEFRRVYARGKSAVRPSLVAYCMKRGGAAPRIGITASKKIGNAVKRNRARRLQRQKTARALFNIRRNFCGQPGRFMLHYILVFYRQNAGAPQFFPVFRTESALRRLNDVLGYREHGRKGKQENGIVF